MKLRKKLSGNLCRCTGYENILNAVEKTKKHRVIVIIQNYDRLKQCFKFRPVNNS